MTDALVWITGASSGIGAALAGSVPFADARVIDISRSGGTPGTEHLPADLSDPAAWAAVEAHLHAQLGSFDGSTVVFVHNAGTLTPVGYAGEVDSSAYRAQVLLNAASPPVLGHAFLAALASSGFQGRAHLLMLSSGAGKKPYEGWSAYCAGKAALDLWVRTVGAEQATRGNRCRVVAVGPGVVATGMQELIRHADAHDFPDVERFVGLYEQDELSEPAEAAQRIWGLLDRELENGAVVDVRSL